MARQNNIEETFLAYLWMLVGSIFFAIMALLAESLKEQFSYPWITMVRSGVATVLAVGLTVERWGKTRLFQAGDALGAVAFGLGKHDLRILRNDSLRCGDRVGVKQHVSAVGGYFVLAIARSSAVHENMACFGD